MSKTDKDNKHTPKHPISYKCPERNCDYCNAKAKENRSSREKRSIEDQLKN